MEKFLVIVAITSSEMFSHDVETHVDTYSDFISAVEAYAATCAACSVSSCEVLLVRAETSEIIKQYSYKCARNARVFIG